MKKEVNKKRTLLKRIAIVISITVVLSVLVVSLWTYGKTSLYSRNNDQIPTLATKEEEIPEDALSDLEVQVWNENWVRYQGEIYQYNEDLLTFLVMGIDSMEEVEAVPQGISGGQADALFLVVCNPDNKEIDLVAINRNTMVDLDLYDSDGYYAGTKEGQIALQHGYGDGVELSCERTVTQVSNLLYGMPIHGYCSINMGAISLLNDTVGGVEVTITEDVEYTGGSFEKGTTELLLGERAYHFLHQRDRNTFDSATDRLNRQKQYIKAFANTLKTQVKTNPTIVFTLYNTVSNYMVTDVSMNEIGYLATTLLNYSFDDSNIHSLQGETLMGEKYEEFYVDEDSLYEMIIEIFYEEVD